MVFLKKWASSFKYALIYRSIRFYSTGPGQLAKREVQAEVSKEEKLLLDSQPMKLLLRDFSLMLLLMSLLTLL